MFDLFQFVADCRDAMAANKSHKYVREVVARAVSDPAGDGDAGFARILDHWSSGQPIIVYCYSDACDAATEVARALRADLPEASIQVLAGGWSAWQESQP